VNATPSHFRPRFLFTAAPVRAIDIGCVPSVFKSVPQTAFGRGLSAAHIPAPRFTDVHRTPDCDCTDDAALPRARTADFGASFEGAVLRAFFRVGIRCFRWRQKPRYALDSPLLRIFLSCKLCLEYRDFFAARRPPFLSRDGKATYSPAGPGAGKSTVATLSPAGKSRSLTGPKISLLRREQPSLRAYGTPFLGEFKAAGSNSSASGRGIFDRLQAGGKPSWCPIRPMAHSAAHSAQCTFLPARTGNPPAPFA